MRIVLISWIVVSLGIAVAGEVAAPVRPVVRYETRLDAESAEWITAGHRLVAFGSGRNVVVAGTDPTFLIRQRRTVSSAIVEGAIAGDRLYVVQELATGHRLAVLDLAEPASEARALVLRPEPSGSLHIAPMDDYLVVAEDGYGLRILSLPAHDHDGGAHHHGAFGLEQVGFLPLTARIEALTAARRSIVASTASGLWVVNASVPSMPVLSAELPQNDSVHSMAANGDVVLMLGAAGLSRLDLGSGSIEEIDPGRQGRGIYWAGRTIYVAAEEGLQSFRDVSPLAATFVVQVGDVFFNPAGTINVNVGDTVQWQKQNTAFFHNVFSCRAGQVGCSALATELFTSGPPTPSAFNFQHTFVVTGSNPYLCQVHNLTMRGDIKVAGAAATPPGVADGSGVTTPMTVGKQNPTGAELSVAFDTGCPDAVDHDILVGAAADLPATPGGTYSASAFQCDIGTVSPFTWTTSPSPAVGDFVWWLIVADDGSNTEGAWGKDSSGVERDGGGANGASGLCGNTEKNITNTCGQ